MSLPFPNLELYGCVYSLVRVDAREKTFSRDFNTVVAREQELFEAMRSRPPGERATQIAGYYTEGQLRNLFRHITSYDAGRQIHEGQLAVFSGKRLGEIFATMTLQNKRASDFRLADILEQQDEDAIAKHLAGRNDYLLQTGVPTNAAYKIAKDEGSFSKKPKPIKMQALVKTRERTAVARISKGKMSAEEKLEKRQSVGKRSPKRSRPEF